MLAAAGLEALLDYFEDEVVTRALKWGKLSDPLSAFETLSAVLMDYCRHRKTWRADPYSKIYRMSSLELPDYSFFL